MKTWKEASKFYEYKLKNRYLLQEDKTRFIDRLNITDEQKEELKAFFKKHPNFEGKIDWNNKNLTYEDFSELLSMEGNTKSSQKKYGLSGQAQIEDLKVGEDYEVLLDTDKYVVYYPLTFKASEILAKPTTPPEGVTGKWCIAGRNYSPGTQDQHWKKYVSNNIDFFFIFTKDQRITYTEPNFYVEFTLEPHQKYALARYKQGFVEMFDSSDKQIFSFRKDEVNFILTEDIDKVIKESPNKLADLYSWTDPETGLTYNKVINALIGSKSVRSDLKVIQVAPWCRTLGEYSLGRIDMPDASIKIPDSVFHLESNCFSNMVVENVYLGKNWWRYIKEDAFTDLYALKVVVPEGTPVIPDYTFGWSHVKEFVLPEGIQSIGHHAFTCIKTIKNINLPSSINWIRAEAFRGCEKLTEIDIPDGCVIIEKGAFAACHNLYRVKLPKELIEISENLFAGCINLDKVEIPEGVRSIGKRAFSSCDYLTTISLPSTLKLIDYEAFYRSNRLQIINYNGTQEMWNAIEMEDEYREKLTPKVKFLK